MGAFLVRRGFQPLEDLPAYARYLKPNDMPTPFAKMKRLLFRVIARTAVATYSRVPIFGYLRASIAVLRKDDLILVIDRNDARGFSFPGGLAHPGETAEQVMRREVEENTPCEFPPAGKWPPWVAARLTWPPVWTCMAYSVLARS